MKPRLHYIGTFGVIVGYAVYMLLFRRDSPTHQGRVIPAEGLVINPAGRTHPGDPEHAAVDFRKMYVAMDRYRKEHGRLPTPNELLTIPGMREEDLTNPDAQYADGFVKGQQNISSYAFSYLAPRPDGSRKPAFPKPGERDVWFVSSDAVRRNQTVFQDHRSDMDFRGAYVVLWSDGQVEQVAVGKEEYLGGRGGHRLSFRGQTGLPKETGRLEDFYKDATKGSRISVGGKPVGKGG